MTPSPATVDPLAVRHASRVASGLAGEHRPDRRRTDPPTSTEAPTASGDRDACGLLNRMIGHLDSRSG